MLETFSESIFRYWENSHYQYRQGLYDAEEYSKQLDTIIGLVTGEAALYVTGFGLFLTVLDPSGYEGHIQKVAFLADNQVALYIGNLLIYVVFGVVLVVLALALHARLKDGSPTMMQTATAFGLIWAGLVIASGMIANIGNSTVVALFSENQDQAVLLWLAISTVQEALGGGNEIVGGLWVLLLSWAALRSEPDIRLNWC